MTVCASLALASCGEHASLEVAQAPPAAVPIGDAVASAYFGAPVPANAKEVPSMSGSNLAGNGHYTAYELPLGVSADALRQWYAVQMPPGQPYQGMPWMGQLAGPGGPDWYWCPPVPGKTLDVAVLQNEAKAGDADSFKTYVTIALQPGAGGSPSCA